MPRKRSYLTAKGFLLEPRANIPSKAKRTGKPYKPNPLVCEFCGNFHDPAYSDCATGEQISLSPQAGKGIEATGEQKNH